MVAAEQNLPSRQAADILQIHFTLGKLSAPAVIADQDKGVPFSDHLPAVLQKFFFMIFPHPAIQLPGCFQHRLIMQMQIADRV